MNQIIKNLTSTTFAGKRFTRKQLVQIQETVKMLPNLNRTELAHTICEHLNWVTHNGSNKLSACLKALEEMEVANIIHLPAKILSQQRGPQKAIARTDRTNEQPNINVSLDDIMPIRLVKVEGKEERSCWNEFVDRYHYLGYRRPIGAHLRYFIVDRYERKLGCLLFSNTTKVLPCRDNWLDWDDKTREKHLHLIVNNNRFLIFPWVKVKCLASKILSIVTRQITQDWEETYNYRPVLLETFVDPTQYKGTCYQAANWTCIGRSVGRKATKSSDGKTQKELYIYPLRKDFKFILIHGEKKKSRPTAQITHYELASDDPFVKLWQNVLGVVSQVADEYDRKWQKRKRLLNTMLMILFIFRLVFSKGKQGYGITIAELWYQCRIMNMPLPQQKPVAASAFCEARKKLDENIFKVLNLEVIKTYEPLRKDDNWYGHRLFAVDGTKINLPKELEKVGYSTPSNNAYYPQGLVSSLYQLQSKIPVDFELVSHKNERTAALEHLNVLQKNSVVIYDRGYFSYAMLHAHVTRGIHAVFRLSTNSFTVIDEFIKSDEVDKTVVINPSKKRQNKILLKNPHIKEVLPLTLRLIKYVHDGTTFILGVTLTDVEKYPTSAFSDVYHSRWGIEELYKISKVLIDVEDFHGKTIRGVKQELFVHFLLITLGRLFANKTDDDFKGEIKNNTDKNSKFKTNFKNCLITVARHLEGLFMKQAEFIRHCINSVFSSLVTCRQKVRDDRAYKRQSRKPIKKWSPPKQKKALQATVVTA